MLEVLNMSTKIRTKYNLLQILVLDRDQLQNLKPSTECDTYTKVNIITQLERDVGVLETYYRGSLGKIPQN